jgi:hypothetical protein
MSTSCRNASLYRIVVTGMFVSAIEGLPPMPRQPSRACILVSVNDEPELYRLLDQLQDLALHIVSVEELTATALPRFPRAG